MYCHHHQRNKNNAEISETSNGDKEDDKSDTLDDKDDNIDIPDDYIFHYHRYKHIVVLHPYV